MPGINLIDKDATITQNVNNNNSEFQNCLLNVGTWILKMLSSVTGDCNAEGACDSQRRESNAEVRTGNRQLMQE